MQPKLASNLESIGGAQPPAGQVNPRFGGPPLAPTWQLWPPASQPRPGQKRIDGSPLSGMSYSTELPRPDSRCRFGALKAMPGAVSHWIHMS